MTEQRAIATALQGKVCLVTGGSRTLGAAIARRMAQYGARVIVNYHQAAEAAEAVCAAIAAGGGEATAIQADVTDPLQVERMIGNSWERFGGLDILVNNVGPYVDTPFLELETADFDRILAGNIRATFLLSRAAGRRMKARGKGTIVNIAATDAFHRSHSVYGLAKAGVLYLTEALALELAPEARIHALAPDLISENEEMDADFAARSAAGTPMARLIRRDEIAEVVCLVCTPSFAMTTGHTIILDGGRSIPRIALREP